MLSISQIKSKNELTSIWNWSRKFSSKAKILIVKEIYIAQVFKLLKRRIFCDLGLELFLLIRYSITL